MNECVKFLSVEIFGVTTTAFFHILCKTNNSKIKVFTTKLLLIFFQVHKWGAFALKACCHKNKHIIG